MTTEFSGTSLVTTEPIPTMLFFPIVTPALITARALIIALSSIVTPIILSHMGYGSFVNTTAGPMKTFFPILDSGGMYAWPSIFVFSPIFTL